MTTAIVYDAIQAQDLIARGIAVDNILALTPNALAAFRGAAIACSRLSSVLTDDRHAAIETALVKSETELRAALAEAPAAAFSAAAGETLRHDLRIAAAVALIAGHTLTGGPGRPEGPWLIFVDSHWREFAARDAAHDALTGMLRNERVGFRQLQRTVPMRWLARAINRFCGRLMRAHPRVVVTGFHYGLRELAPAMAKAPWKLRCVQVRGGGGGIADFLHPLIALLRHFAGGGGTLVAVPDPSPAAVGIAASALSVITDPDIRRGLAAYGPAMTREAAAAHGLGQPMGELLAAVDPRAVIAHSLRWGDEAALGAATLASAIPCFLASHGSHGPQPAGVAASSVHANADGLLVSPFAKTALMQSPHADALARDLAPDAGRAAIRPIMWGRRAAGAAAPRKIRRILHAGTFKPLTGPRPFLYETADDFVVGLEALVSAVGGLENCELIIRARENPECSLGDLAALLPEAPNVTIKSDGDFKDDLAAADVLVSYASTTIEEALISAKPVILWGGTRRYRHLPARETTPSATDRAAVYAPSDAASLASFMAAVLDAHAGLPLTRAELDGHVWPPETPGEDELFTAIAGSSPMSTFAPVK